MQNMREKYDESLLATLQKNTPEKLFLKSTRYAFSGVVARQVKAVFYGMF